MKLFITIFSLLMIQSCATRFPSVEGVPEISESQYENMIAKKTGRVEVYSGLYNTLTVQATRLDAELSLAQSAYAAKLSQLSLEAYNQEKSKLIIKHSEVTEFFVSFFVPERRLDDLTQKKTTWKIYLEVNGLRYEGHATKIKSVFADLAALYPHHNIWSTPYSVTFPVSTPATEGKPLKLTFSGPTATGQINFE